MPCSNHHARTAQSVCTGCGRGFCPDCVVHVLRGTWCRRCKELHLPTAGGQMAQGAQFAVGATVASAFLCGITFPYAFLKARQAWKDAEDKPWLRGRARSLTTMLLSGMGSFLLVAHLLRRVL